MCGPPNKPTVKGHAPCQRVALFVERVGASYQAAFMVAEFLFDRLHNRRRHEQPRGKSFVAGMSSFVPQSLLSQSRLQCWRHLVANEEEDSRQYTRLVLPTPFASTDMYRRRDLLRRDRRRAQRRFPLQRALHRGRESLESPRRLGNSSHSPH
jgi:hypothetical protein